MTVLDCDSSPGWPASCEDRHPDCLAADLVDASRHLLIARVSCPTRHPREPRPRGNMVIAGLAVLRRLIHATSPLFVYWARRATRPGRPGSVRCSFGVPDPPLVQRGLGIALRRVLPNLLAAARSDVEVGDGRSTSSPGRSCSFSSWSWRPLPQRAHSRGRILRPASPRWMCRSWARRGQSFPRSACAAILYALSCNLTTAKPRFLARSRAERSGRPSE